MGSVSLANWVMYTVYFLSDEPAILGEGFWGVFQGHVP
jgi:hypothetical protein